MPNKSNTPAYDLTRDPIPRLIRQIAVPASMGFFFNTMYNATDTYFAGMISTQALAALGLAFPVFFIIISLGTGVSSGTTALIASALGGGNREEATLYARQGLGFGILVSIVVTLLGFLVTPPLYRLMGAEGQYLADSLSYMLPIFAGSVFFVMNYMFNSVLNSRGDTKPFRNFLALGFLLNIGLDPWFIYGGLGLPPLGIKGVALATVLIQAIGCVYLGKKARATGMLSDHGLKGFLPSPRALLEIARQGLPPSFNFMTIGIGIFVITYFISQYGKEAVAAYGSANRIEQFVLMPAIGLGTATLTLVAQNAGAGQAERVWKAVNSCLRYGALMMGAGTIFVFSLAGPLMSLFTDDPRVVEIGRSYMRVDAFTLYAYVLLNVSLACLQGIKRPMFAIGIGLYRQILAPAIVFYLMVRILDLGLFSVWVGIFAITWSAALFTFFFSRKKLRQVIGNP